MKKFYFAVMKIYSNNKQCSHVLAVPESVNLVSVLKKNNYDIMHPCETKKKAQATAEFWNECAVKNGVYLYDHIYPASVVGP